MLVEVSLLGTRVPADFSQLSAFESHWGRRMERVLKFVLASMGMLLISGRFAFADQWPQAKAALYFDNCVRVHTELWKGMPEATLFRVCNCKLSMLRRHEYPPKSHSFEALEMWAGLPEKQRMELFEEADDKLKVAMFLVADAEETCAPK